MAAAGLVLALVQDGASRASMWRPPERVRIPTRSGVSVGAGNAHHSCGSNGFDLRRLYSTFAGSGPGVGLLLIRIVCGSVIVVRAGGILGVDAPLHATLTAACLAGSGLLLSAGLWTPLAGAVVAGLEFRHILTTGDDVLVPLLLGTVGGALALLGPGRWSIDARLFGWKRIEATPRRARSNER